MSAFTAASFRRQGPAHVNAAWPQPAARVDGWIALLLGLMIGVFVFIHASQINPKIITLSNWKIHSLWFEADSPRYFEDMTHRHSDHKQSTMLLHPLFPLMTYPLIMAIRVVLQVSALAAMRLLLAGFAGVWLAALFLMMRGMNCKRADAALLSLLASVSAAAWFWFVVPETWPLSSLTLIASLAAVLISEYRAIPIAGWVVIQLAALGATITNWATSILAAFTALPARKALRVAAITLMMAVTVSLAQKRIIPNCAFIFSAPKAKNISFFFHPYAGSTGQVLASLALHSMVMPKPQIIERYTEKQTRLYRRILSVQGSRPGSGSVWGAVGVRLWFALLIMGLYGLFLWPGMRRFRLALGLALLGNIALHLIYGEESFLYALHLMPMYILLVACALHTRLRVVVLGLSAALLVCAAMNNSRQFAFSVKFIQDEVSSNGRHGAAQR